jgi:hypothetical protein
VATVTTVSKENLDRWAAERRQALDDNVREAELRERKGDPLEAAGCFRLAARYAVELGDIDRALDLVLAAKGCLEIVRADLCARLGR